MKKANYSTLSFLFVIILVSMANFPLLGQTNDKLVAHYSFNDSTANDVSGNGKHGILEGNPTFGCGVNGSALWLDGIDDYVLLLGMDNFFITTDFTISFYFKSTSSFGTQSIISKREECDANHALAIRYTPVSNSITTEVSESTSKRAVITEQLDFNSCWQHIVLIRNSFRTQLYLNGEIIGNDNTNSRVDLTSSGVLSIAQSPCLSTTDNPFAGLIDEVRIYNRALSKEEVRGLYLAPDKIGNLDTLIFLGNSFQAFIPNTCADAFTWTPTESVSDPNISNPVLSPTETTTYDLQISDVICIGADTLRVTVVDPSDLDCKKTFLPNAFTPNGDGRNEIFRISNPYAIDLITFEIFDRWGSRVFFTDSPFEGWDGSFKGQDMNPGVLLYRVRFRCEGIEEVAFGSFSLIR